MLRALLDPATAIGTPRLLADRHGKLRARTCCSLGELLGEYHAMRRHLTGLDEIGSDLHAALDHASAVAAGAFHAERARQYQVVRQGQDHALRGCVNAIRLAAFVQRETGRDTADVVERHTTSVSALLDQARDALAPRHDKPLQPDDMPADDLTAACRQRLRAWNDRHAGVPCDFASLAACTGHFDIVRVGETLNAMVDAAAQQAGNDGVLTVSLGSRQGMAVLTVEARAAAMSLAPSPATSSRPATDSVVPSPTPNEWTLIWLLGHQTAADHHGTLEAEANDDRLVFRLSLRHAAAASDL